MAGVEDWYNDNANPLNESTLGDTPTLGTEGPTDFQKWATGQTGEQKLSQSIREASKKNPDRQADVFKLQGKTGLPAPLIERNYDLVNARASQADFDAKKFRQEFPQLSGLLEQRENAEIAHDDLEALQSLERTLTREEFEDMGPIDWVLEAPRAAYKQGNMGEERNFLAFRQLMGDADENLESQITNLEGKLGNDYSGDSWIGTAITSASEFLPQTLSSLAAGVETGVSGGIAGGTMAAVAGQLGPQAATPEEIVTVPVATAAGFAAGSRTGAAQYSFRQEAGAAFREFKGFRDADGNPISEQTARVAAVVSGGINSGLEVFGLETLVKSFPGGKKALSGVSRGAIKEALKNPTVARAMGDLAKRFAGVWSVETMTEVLQEGVTIISGEVAKQYDPGDFEGLSAEQVEQRLTETFTQAASGMAILSAPGPLTNFAVDYGRVRGAQRNQRVMESLGEGASASKVRERLPEKFREMVGKIREGGKIENVQVPVDKWDELFQSAGLDPMEMSNEVIGNYDAYTEAKATGGDLLIPIEAYAEKLAASEWHAQITDNARFRPEEMTPSEARDWQANEQDMIQNFVDSVSSEQVNETQAIYDDVFGQLQAAGRDNVAAEREAKLTQSVFRSLADRMGTDPVELYRQYNVSIKRPLPEILKRKGGDFDPTIDPILDRLRAGDMPSQSDAFGQSLLEWLRERGVQDPGGDLASRDIDKNLRPFERRAIREEGTTLDNAAREAVLSGYMPGFDPDTVTQNDLLTFVEKELQGEPVFPIEGGSQQLRESREAMLALQEYLDNLGIDLSQMDNPAVRAMLSGRQEPARTPEAGEGVTLEQGVDENAPLPDTAGITVEEGGDFAEFQRLIEQASGEPGQRQAGQEPGTTISGGQADNGWRDATSIRGSDGQPAIIYRGARRGLSPADFQPEAIGQATGNPSAPLGVWFTSDQTDATRYGQPEQFYLDLRNPRVYQTEKVPQFDSPDQAVALREQLQAEGYDGIVFDYTDQQGPIHAISFGPEQVIQPDTVSLNQDQTETSEFRAWAGENAELVESDRINDFDFSGPGPFVVRVFHGTTNDFSVFDATQKGNLEGQFGAVNYFTSDRDDAETNYAGEGPDLTSRIEQRAERLEDEIADAIETDGIEAVAEFYGLDADALSDDPADIATEVARRELSGGADQTMELFVRTERPFVVGADQSPFIELIDFEQLENDAIERVADDEGVTVDEVRENIDDYQDQVDDARMDLEADQENPLIEAIETVASRYDFDAADLLEAVSDFSLEGGMQSELEQLLRNTESLSYAEDPETGDLAGFHALGEIIQEMGYDSIILKNANERFSNMAMGGNTAHVHVFNSTPENIKSATGNVGAFSRQSPDIFMQGQGRQRGPRGRITFPQSRRFFNIELLETADLSTFLHESGHLYLEVIRDLAGQEDAPQQLRDDFQTILNWFEVESADQIGTDQHEQWARGFEAYVMEGNAPSAELRSVFARFRAWLMAIYRTVKNLNVDLTDDVRGVMDRLVATDQEIAEAQDQASYQPLFDSSELAGMTADEFAQYQKLAMQARQESEDDVTRQVMTEYQRERQKWWRDAKAEVREQVAAEVNQQPEYVAASVMGRGKMPDGSDLPEGMEQFKMSKEILVDLGFGSSLKRLPRPYVYTRQGGIHPEQAAELFGYRSADQMIQSMIEARPRQKLIEAETNKRMNDRYGDMMEDGGLADAAENAVHNDRRADVMMTELRKLGVKSNRRTPPKQVLAEAAQRIIAQKRVRDVQPGQYSRAESRAGRQAFDAVASGDFEAATQAKQRQVFNHYLYREAERARQEADKTVDLMTKYTKKAPRQRIGKAGADYLEQIDGLLARYEFRRGVTLRQIDKRATLREWVDSQNEQGFTVDIPDEVLNDARTVNYREVSVEELRGIRDTVKQIEHMARLKNKLLASADERSFEEQVDAIVSTIDENHSRNPEPPQYTESMKKRLKDFVGDAHAWHMKPEFIFRWLDGDAETGTVWRALFKPLADAEIAEQQMQERVTKELNEIMSEYTRAERAKWHTQKYFIKGIGQSMNKASVLSVALNWGNDYNRQVMMEGHGWNEAQVAEIIGKLDGRDWSMVQSLWDLIDGFWPDIAQMERDLTGVAPEKVQARPIETEYGAFKGGYYPIKYDPTAAVKTARREEKAGDSLFENSYTKPATRKGHTKERTGSGGQRVRLDLDVLSEHIAQVTHDLTHRRAIVDVNRLSENKQVREAIQQTGGRQIYDQIRPWLQATANEVLQPQSFWEKLIGRARVGATVVNMGFKVTTAIVQPLGYLNSVDMLGSRYSWRGLRDFFGNRGDGDFYAPWRNMKNSTAFVMERSVMMQNRQKNFDRDVRDSLRRLTKETRLQQAQRSFFILTGLMDMSVSVPTWLGAYKKAMEGAVDEIPPGNEQRAIDYADSIVRQTQSAGGVKDLARIQRGGEVQRSFVMFYSYFSVLYNQFARKAGRIKSGQAGVAELAASAFFLWFAPAILGELVAMRGPDDEDEWAEWAARQAILYPAGTVVGVRDVANAALTPFGYGASPAFDAFAMTARAATIPFTAVNPDEEVTRADVKSAVLAAGYWGKLPSRQMWITGEYLYDLATGVDEPESPQEFVRDLFFSRPVDER